MDADIKDMPDRIIGQRIDRRLFLVVASSPRTAGALEFKLEYRLPDEMVASKSLALSDA